MAPSTSYNGMNSGIQIAENYAPITTNFVQLETSMNHACLRGLRTTNPHDDKSRIQNSNGGLLKDSYRWILDNEMFKQWQDNQKDRLLWIRGDPGKGKTMLLCGIIEELTQYRGSTANVSFFFCQATDVRINSATSVLRGLIYLLVQKNPSLLFHVRARYDQAGKALFEDTNAWDALSAIFTDILKDSSLKGAYFIIDALDECINGLRPLLNLIIQASSAHLQIKWIVSSRNWLEIIERLDIATQVAPISLELNEAAVSEAVEEFIRNKVNTLAKVKRYTDRTRDRIYRHLLLNSQGTFLWVALVCQSLDGTPPRQAINMLQAFPPGLNALYGRMVDKVRQSQDAELCKQILAIMSTVFRPITLSELTSFLKLPDNDVDGQDSLSQIIALCGSFLTIRENTITFVHQSAKEFLLREVMTEVFPRGIGAEHHIIFSQSLNVMFETLQRDVLNIKLPGFSIKDLRQPSPNPLAAVEYACVYWIDHLQLSERNESYDLSLNDRGLVDEFLRKKYLHWLEALSILGSVSNGIQAMKKLEILLQLITWSPDGSRLASASWDRTVRIWDPVTGQSVFTLDGHSQSVNSISWSPDGSRLAGISINNIVRVWDLATSQSMSTFEGYNTRVRPISWSPDGSCLASASWDTTVRIWDPVTGQSVFTLDGHSQSVNSISWSPDGSRLASASDDKIVVTWDPNTGQSLSALEGHTQAVSSITWSPDGTRLASASDDMTVRIWDSVSSQTVTSQRLSTLTGHSQPVNPIAWSPDGSRLASASDDMTVRIWDPVTGHEVSTLEGHCSGVTLIAWSPDGSQLASASDDTVSWKPTICVLKSKNMVWFQGYKVLFM
ncbi:hypothetical protein N7488_007166 [Penicillium malachiteum]|nr:hypothetical protein N7488_007166 [Penicillium malachiteum]